MLTFEDCVALSDLSEDEVLAIAAHEHVPLIAAAQLGDYLCHSPEGEMCIKAMIRDDIAQAATCGERERELALKLMLRNFVLQHPHCDERRRQELDSPRRRVAGIS